MKYADKAQNLSAQTNKGVPSQFTSPTINTIHSTVRVPTWSMYLEKRWVVAAILGMLCFIVLSLFKPIFVMRESNHMYESNSFNASKAFIFSFIVGGAFYIWPFAQEWFVNYEKKHRDTTIKQKQEIQ